MLAFIVCCHSKRVTVKCKLPPSDTMFLSSTIKMCTKEYIRQTNSFSSTLQSRFMFFTMIF